MFIVELLIVAIVAEAALWRRRFFVRLGVC
jgi:hypothetical protein